MTWLKVWPHICANEENKYTNKTTDLCLNHLFFCVFMLTVPDTPPTTVKTLCSNWTMQ